MYLLSIARNDLFESYLDSGFDFDEARDMARDTAGRLWDFDQWDD